MKTSIYQEIAKRTGGDIYIGVVGPVRTGKSTFIKRFMETLVIPNIEDPYWQERAKDELPQSASGKTIMTAEPKFIPEEAVSISPDGTAKLRVRMIDSVGYMIPGAMGAIEDGKPRMVTTPWLDHEIPMTDAAELGTQKVMEEHSTVGIVITTDGTITDIERADYIESEQRAIEDMQKTGKPFVVIINSSAPQEPTAQTIKQSLEQKYQVHCICADCQSMDEQEIGSLLSAILYEFPLRELQIYLPAWISALEMTHPLKSGLYTALREKVEGVSRLMQTEAVLMDIAEQQGLPGCTVRQIDPGKGIVIAELQFSERLFYSVLGEKSGLEIKDDADLIRYLEDLSKIKREYDRMKTALAEVEATGYGIVMPEAEDMELDVPEIVKKGSNYGVKLRARADAVHMIKCAIRTEICPMVGDEQQSSDLVDYLMKEYEGSPEKLWQSNLFGKSVYELVNDGLTSKLKRMPESARLKMRDTIGRIINEGCNGLICIIL